MNFSKWQKKKIFDYSALDITVKSIFMKKQDWAVLIIIILAIFISC